MFRNRITLFRLLGFDVRVDASWLLLAFFITWSLARGYFPGLLPGHSLMEYWWMGAAGALGLFVSIILHEFSHSLVARRYGLPIKGITLFIFGGVAEMEDEPPNAKSEFLMAIAGPIASLAIGAVCYAAAVVMAGPQAGALDSVLHYLGVINVLLALFNLAPAFPLDGGRVLRAALWQWQGNLRKATRIAASIGRGFGFWLILMGVFSVLAGNLLGGVWWFLIGLFVIQSAGASYQQVLLRQTLEGEPVRRFMTEHPTCVLASETVQRLVDDYIYRHYYKLYPVLQDDHPVGCIHTDQIKTIPREEWGRHTVGEIMQPLTADNTVPADADAMQALNIMNRSGNSRLLVMEDGHLAGLIALKDLLKFFHVKVDLEEGGSDKRWFER
ncbi:MAG TPA: site-2 protease family protein [bacterium]|nr:site-2 protease family protein [bacterium]